MSWHELSFFFFTIGLALVFRTVLIASSKTSLRPCCVKALHSMYLHWNSSSIIFLAVYFWMGASLGSFLISWYSYLKSTLLPTKILGTFPTFSVNYGYHWIMIDRYFFSGVDKRGWLDNRKDDKENIAVWICERSESVVLLLAGCVP